MIIELAIAVASVLIFLFGVFRIEQGVLTGEIGWSTIAVYEVNFSEMSLSTSSILTFLLALGESSFLVAAVVALMAWRMRSKSFTFRIRDFFLYSFLMMSFIKWCLTSDGFQQKLFRFSDVHDARDIRFFWYLCFGHLFGACVLFLVRMAMGDQKRGKVPSIK